MPALDSIFRRSPNTPVNVDMPAVLGSPSAPLILVMTYTTEPSLWINVGVVSPLVVNGETFTDNGWTLLAILRDNAAIYSDNPLSGGNEVYQDLQEPTRQAVLDKLAERSVNGALQRLSNAFYRLLTA